MFNSDKEIIEKMFNEISIQSSNWIYRLDLTLKKEIDNNRVLFSGTGSCRIGPKKGEIISNSIFCLEKEKWVEGHYRIKGLSVYEEFKYEDNRYIVNKGNKLKSIPSNSSIFDPISTFFLITETATDTKTRFETNIILGGKLRPIEIRDSKVFYKDKKWVDAYKQDGEIKLKLPSIKLVLQAKIVS